MLVGLGASYLRKPQYESRATLLMTPAPPTAQDVTPQLNEMVQREQERVLSGTKLATIITDPRMDLYSDERKNTPLEDVIDEMRRNIRIEYARLPGKHSKAFNILFNYPDKLKAQRTVNALISAFEYQNMEMQRGEQDRLHGYVLEVMDPASLPVSPAGPDRVKFALFGCLLGFLLAGVITVVRGGVHSRSAPMLATNE
jgi:LPS O-antigen subunit length determinant protein (WzzB/FepE family)